MDEFLWTKEKTVYRKGPDDSYKEAGTLETDKMVKEPELPRTNGAESASMTKTITL